MSEARPLRFAFSSEELKAQEIMWVGWGEFHGEEDYPRIKSYIGPVGFPLGEDAGRIVSDVELGEFHVRIFHISSGCGMIIEEGKVAFTESELKALEGHQVLMRRNTDGALVVATESGNLAKALLDALYQAVYGLSLVFCRG